MTTTETPAFQLLGGSPCLDFVNTMDGLREVCPRERLGCYQDLLAWAGEAGLLSRAEGARLRREAEAHPRRAAEALAEAVRLREALHGVLLAAVLEEPAPATDLSALNSWIAAVLAQRVLVQQRDGFGRAFAAGSGDLLAFLRPVAADADELLGSARLEQVRRCAECDADRCGWLFLDDSKNHSRRFCEMRSCGNRAKARRHYARAKSSPP